jgi:exopolysaccharide production protein ExoZ
MSTVPNRFEYIEIGRGIASLLVVCFHTTAIVGLPKYFGQPPLDGIFSFGYAGVDFFFVLSGFIIFYSTAGNHANPASVKTYVKHRLIRIYPIYWVVCLLILPLSYLMSHPVSASNAAMDFLLIPRGDHPFVIVAWTLRHEMLFYLSFVLFFLNVTLAWVYFLLWGGMIAVCNILSLDITSPFSSLYLNDHNLEFLAGIFVGYIAKSRQVLWCKPGFLVLSGAMIFVASGLNESLVHHGYFTGNSHYHLVYGIGASLMVSGLIGLKSDMKNYWVRIGTFLGRASYSIYLIHFAVLSAVIKVLHPFGLALWVNMVLLTLSGVLIGSLQYRYIEAPLLTAIRNRFL